MGARIGSSSPNRGQISRFVNPTLQPRRPVSSFPEAAIERGPDPVCPVEAERFVARGRRPRGFAGVASGQQLPNEIRLESGGGGRVGGGGLGRSPGHGLGFGHARLQGRSGRGLRVARRNRTIPLVRACQW